MRRNDPDLESVAATEELPFAPEAVLAALSPVVLPRRLERLQEVVSHRTRRIAVVLDGISDPHNMSAVLRSADAFGVQDVHVVESDQPFKAARAVAKGSHRWLDVRKHTSGQACADVLQGAGYRLYVASMEGALSPTDLHHRVDAHPVALVFGNEHRGPGTELRARAEGTFAIGMRGFVESLNVSVAAAITLFAVRGDRPGDLNAGERAELLARFLLRTVRDAERIVKESVADTAAL